MFSYCYLIFIFFNQVLGKKNCFNVVLVVNLFLSSDDVTKALSLTLQCHVITFFSFSFSTFSHFFPFSNRNHHHHCATTVLSNPFSFPSSPSPTENNRKMRLQMLVEKTTSSSIRLSLLEKTTVLDKVRPDTWMGCRGSILARRGWIICI